MRRLLLSTLCAAFALPAVSQPALDLSSVEARSRLDGALASDLRLLAGARALTAGTGTFAREGPTLRVDGGPRRDPDATTSDLAAGVDLPVVLDAGPARRAEAALRAAEAAIEAAARLEARRRLRSAYAEAWLAVERAGLLDEQARLGEEWLRVTARRVEAGAAAPYEAALVEGDLLRARAERDRAYVERAAAWAVLRETADVGEAPEPLAPPPVPEVGRAEGTREAFARGVLAAGLAARETVEETSLDLERSLARERWSLAASVGKEGEEVVARAGLAYRLPLGGEAPAREAERAAARDVQAAARRAARAALEARLSSALARAAAFGDVPDPGRFSAAIAAVGLRLSEGKEAPASALLLRRQLVEASLLALERRRDAFLLADEIDTLTKGGGR